jgi:hypothetical protein
MDKNRRLLADADLWIKRFSFEIPLYSQKKLMAITLDRAEISALKTYKIASGLEYTYLALRWGKDPNNSTQDIDTDDFQAKWGVSNSDLLKYLQSLETKKVLKINPTQMTITWGETESTTITQEEVLAMKKDGLINTTTYVYYALLLNKGGGLTQTVNPDNYSTSPWSITPSTLLQEIVNISQRKNQDSSNVITLDLTNVTVVWLI